MATLLTLQPCRRAGARLVTTSSGVLGKVFALWHLTSLDAPTVAVVWTLAFAWAARVRLPLWLPAALALAAWSVYIGDRLLDARNARTPLRERHRFHWRHRRSFLPLACSAGAAAIAIFLYYMPAAARGRNSALAAAALLYFGSVHHPWQANTPRLRQRLPKELLVGILFTLACATPAWARSLPAQRLQLLAPALVFIALAWLNCQAIEFWESRELEAKPISRLGTSLAAASLITSLVAATQHSPRQAALLAAAAASAMLLAMLDRLRHRMSPVLLRAAADLVLLTPLFLLVFA